MFQASFSLWLQRWASLDRHELQLGSTGGGQDVVVLLGRQPFYFVVCPNTLWVDASSINDTPSRYATRLPLTLSRVSWWCSSSAPGKSLELCGGCEEDVPRLSYQWRSSLAQVVSQFVHMEHWTVTLHLNNHYKSAWCHPVSESVRITPLVLD